MIEVNKIRQDFPMLQQKVYGKPLIYLDNAATTQKPLIVIDTISEFYKTMNSNIHRGVHYFADRATIAYEAARKTVQEYIHAPHLHEIIFTRGTTDSINLLAFSFGEAFVRKGDEIIISAFEHHSNIVPWQMLCLRKEAKLVVIPFNENQELELSILKQKINEKTRIIAITHISNSLGTVNPVKEIIQIAHAANVPVLIDGAQSAQHVPINVQDLDCDFFAFSGHKTYGPNGIGILFGKEKWLEKMPPYQGGGDMIADVTFEKTTYNELPLKFEAGTPDYVEAVGLSKALNYISEIGIENIALYETELHKYAYHKLKQIEGFVSYGNAKECASIISFLIDGIHSFDIGMTLDKMGIATRTGTHCTQPVMDYFKIKGTVRASLSFYNTYEEIEALYEGLLRIRKMFL